jgi:hypothetical protein
VYARDPYGPGQTIIDLSDSTTQGVLFLGLGSGGRLVYIVDNRPDPGAVRGELVSPDPMPRFRWTHVAVTQSLNSVSMLWDGVVVVRSRLASWRVIRMYRLASWSMLTLTQTPAFHSSSRIRSCVGFNAACSIVFFVLVVVDGIGS